MFSIFSEAFHKSFDILFNLFDVFFAHTSLDPSHITLVVLLLRFNHNEPKSNKSSIHHTGSCSVDSLIHSSVRYLYVRISLPSFVHNKLMSIFILSNGLVTHLITAEALANAEIGAFANACVTLVRLPGSTFTPFSSSVIFRFAHRNLSQNDLFCSSRYFLRVKSKLSSEYVLAFGSLLNCSYNLSQSSCVILLYLLYSSCVLFSRCSTVNSGTTSFCIRLSRYSVKRHITLARFRPLSSHPIGSDIWNHCPLYHHTFVGSFNCFSSSRRAFADPKLYHASLYCFILSYSVSVSEFT